MLALADAMFFCSYTSWAHDRSTCSSSKSSSTKPGKMPTKSRRQESVLQALFTKKHDHVLVIIAIGPIGTFVIVVAVVMKVVAVGGGGFFCDDCHCYC